MMRRAVYDTAAEHRYVFGDPFGTSLPAGMAEEPAAMAFLTQGEAVTADAPAEDAAAPLCMIDPTRPGTGFYPRPGAVFLSFPACGPIRRDLLLTDTRCGIII